MIDGADWSRAADPSRRVGREVEFHPRIASTNDRARVALGEPGGEGLAVVADEQTAGRGRRGRSWLSPPGRNLLASVALRPRAPMHLARLIGFSAALGVLRASSAAAGGGGLSIRWPNDVVDRDGRKVAGLLVETAVEGDAVTEAVIGFGINVNWRRNEMPAEIRGTATSLADLAGKEIDRVALLRGVLDAFDRELVQLERGLSPIPHLRHDWWLSGREVEVDLGGDIVRGRVVGVDDDGALQLEADGARMALTIGEVVRVLDVPVAAFR